jgi:CubicO group peptidase (beta-lactamase class C family)
VVRPPTTFDRRRLLAAFAGVLALPAAPSLVRPHGAAARDEPRYWPTSGWRQAQPEDAGLDPDMFDLARERIETEVPSLSAFVVAYRGDLVFEHYANGFTARDVTDIWSSTKSITSAAIGIAIDDGVMSLDSTIADLIPERIPVWQDPAVGTITVEDLLRMCSGLAWDGAVDFANVTNSPDWVERTLSLPLVAKPGTAHTYNSGLSHLLSVMLQSATGKTLRDFAQERIFTPIGTEITDWLESPQGESAGGVGLNITPREMLKFGFLFLNNGRWDEKQIVSEEWVRESTTFQVQPIDTNNFGRGSGYGYHWWLDDTLGIPAYFALGYGESDIWVIPDLEMVIACAIETVPPLDAPGLQARPRPIIREVLIPGVAETLGLPDDEATPQADG